MSFLFGNQPAQTYTLTAVLTHCNWTEFIESTVVGRVQTQKSSGRGFLWRHLCQLNESYSSNQQQARLWMPKRESGVYIERAPQFLPTPSCKLGISTATECSFLTDQCQNGPGCSSCNLTCYSSRGRRIRSSKLSGQVSELCFWKKNEQKRLGMWACVFVVAHLLSSIQKALGWNPSTDVEGRLTKVSRSNWWLKFAN